MKTYSPKLIKQPWPTTEDKEHWRVLLREEILDSIAKILKHSDYRCVYLSGPPGIGKSIIGFLYYFFRGAKEMTRARFIHSEKLKDLMFPQETIDQPYVRLIDGVDEHEDPSVLLCSMANYLDEHPHARILFTARENLELPDVLTSVTYKLKLNPFSRAETQAFLGQLEIKELTKTRIDIIHDQLEGHPASLGQLAEILYSGIASVNQLLDYLDLYYWPGLISVDGSPIRKGSKADLQIGRVLGRINEQIIAKLALNPALVHELPPRTFEELVADLLERQGYTVQLTPATRDGGKDIYAVSESSLGSFLYVVECKKYAPDRPVGVALVRHLYGVVQAERASAGILVTTSSFTHEAVEWQRPLRYQLSLRDYDVLKHWLASLSNK